MENDARPTRIQDPLPAYPLKASANRRYLVDQQDHPFLVHGDTAWSIITALSKEEAVEYLENRQAKGFNAIIVNLVEHKFNGPQTREGDAPFTNPWDFATPNERYWAHADWVLHRAASLGMLVFLAPLYLGYKGPKNDEGWCVEALASGVAKCHVYGRFVGQRYAHLDNLIWMLGGDRNPGDAREHVAALVNGIKDFDSRHLFTAHPAPESSPADEYGWGNWLNLNLTYSYAVVHRKLLADYNRQPAWPFVLIESSYEGEHNASPVQIRRQAYWSILCGSCGQFLGNNPIWGFFPGWQAALDSEGSRDMVHLKRLFSSRPWYDLTPDQFSPKPWFELVLAEEPRVVVDGLGEQNGMDFLAAAYTTDRGTLIAYLPTARTVTVNLARLSGTQKAGWWFNPRDGVSGSIGNLPGEDLARLTPPAEGDWVLVIDDAVKALPAPG